MRSHNTHTFHRRPCQSLHARSDEEHHLLGQNTTSWARTLPPGPEHHLSDLGQSSTPLWQDTTSLGQNTTSLGQNTISLGQNTTSLGQNTTPLWPQ